MFLVIQKRDYSNIGSTSFDVVMYTKDYYLAIDFASCKRKEAEEKGDHNYYYSVVKFPEVAVSQESEDDLSDQYSKNNDLN